MDNPGFRSPSSKVISSSLRMIAPHETLESILSHNSTLKTPRRNDVFNRLFVDSAIRRKNREISINSMRKTVSKTSYKGNAQGNRIEDILIRKGKELNLKKQKLIDRIEEERNQNIRNVPEINSVSKMLANTDYVNRYYSGGYTSSYGGSTLRNSNKPVQDVIGNKTRPLSAVHKNKYEQNRYSSPKHVELNLDFEEVIQGNHEILEETEKMYYEALEEAERLNNLAPQKQTENTKLTLRTPEQRENLEFSNKVENQKLMLSKLQSTAVISIQPYSFGNTFLEPESKEAYLQPLESQEHNPDEDRYTPFIKQSAYSGEGLYPERTPILNLGSPTAISSSHPNFSSLNSLRSIASIDIPDCMTDRVLLQSPPNPPNLRYTSREVTTRSSAKKPYLLNLKSNSNISVERSAVLKQLIINRKKPQNRQKSRK